MSRRSRREQPAERPARGRPAPEQPPRAEPERPRWELLPTLGIAVGVFAGVTLVAWAAGAANLGVALGIGQVAFALVVVALMVWR
jgi:hypothetical protein